MMDRGNARVNRARYIASIQGNYSYIAKSEEKGERRRKNWRTGHSLLRAMRERVREKLVNT